jgi:hypothetical protein
MERCAMGERSEARQNEYSADPAKLNVEMQPVALAAGFSPRAV